MTAPVDVEAGARRVTTAKAISEAIAQEQRPLVVHHLPG